MTTNEEGKDYCSFMSESTGGRPAVEYYVAIAQKKETAQGNVSTFNEYYISIDMAKEIRMIQRSDKGRQFRQYFIADKVL